MFKISGCTLMIIAALLMAGCKKDNINIADLNYNVYDQNWPKEAVIKIDSVYRTNFQPEASYFVFYTLDLSKVKAFPKSYVVRLLAGHESPSYEVHLRQGQPTRSIEHRGIGFRYTPQDSLFLHFSIDFNEEPGYNTIYTKMYFPVR